MTGLNTLLLSASTQATPDLVALAVTPDANGLLTLAGSPGAGAFSVATVNVGRADSLPRRRTRALRAYPSTFRSVGRSRRPAYARGGGGVTVQIDPGSTPTFAVFVFARGAVPYDPAANRIFVRFKDADGTTRGATSVAVKTP